jgi:hypothetical protein
MTAWSCHPITRADHHLGCSGAREVKRSYIKARCSLHLIVMATTRCLLNILGVKETATIASSANKL